MISNDTSKNLSKDLRETPLDKLRARWDDIDRGGTYRDAIRWLCLNDRYYLLVKMLKRYDLWHPWLYARCREVESDPNGHLDIWFREAGKSSVITVGGAVQEVLGNPDITIAIFSHTKPIAKAFLAQIKREFESNVNLIRTFPDILWADPQKQAKVWSLDAGIIVQRRANHKEATIEAHGLVDGQPTSRHFDLRIYDDVVVPESVTTPEQISKTTEAWELSDNLGREGGRLWVVGTRYSHADTYQVIMDKGALSPRIYPCTHDGTLTGKPVLWSEEYMAQKLLMQSDAVFSCHCADTSILMADWTYKRIQDVQPGDWIVGIEQKYDSLPVLARTKVLATRVRRALAREYRTEEGSVVRCTPDHMWWTKRGVGGRNGDGHYPYSALRDLRKRHDLRTLIRVSNFHGWDRVHDSDPAWQYLAGIFDGEGSVTGKSRADGGGSTLFISQSKGHNPEVHARIIETLRHLGIDFGTHERKPTETTKGSTLFYLKGGRHVRHKFLLSGRPAKRKAIINSLYCGLGGKSSTHKERVVSYEELGEQDVYTMETGTGNYVANGFVSKNCQNLCSPLAGKSRMFDIADLMRYEARPETLMVYILVDPARSVKKDSAHTAMVVLGLDYAGNKYLLDGRDHKMALQDRWAQMRNLYVRWRREPGIVGVRVGYERFGAIADLDYFEERMQLERLRFDITPLEWPREGPGSKVDRVQRLTPDLKLHRFYLPHPTDPERLTSLQRRMEDSGYGYRISQKIRALDEDKQMYDLTERLVMQISYFPFGDRVDLVDALSRIYDMDPAPPTPPADEHDLEPDVV